MSIDLIPIILTITGGDPIRLLLLGAAVGIAWLLVRATKENARLNDEVRKRADRLEAIVLRLLARSGDGDQ